MKLKKGTLYVRLLDGKPELLFYTSEKIAQDQRPFLIHTIAKMAMGTAKPNFGEAVEPFQSGMRSFLGNLVAFRQASSGDIKLFLDKWTTRPGTDIESWAKDVGNCCPGLADSEKKRISKVAAHY